MTSSVYCLWPHLKIQTYMIQYVFTLTAKAVLFLNVLHLDLELEMRWNVSSSFVFLFSFNTHNACVCNDAWCHRIRQVCVNFLG